MERVEDTDRGERLRKIIESQRDIAAADLDLGAVMTLICERTQELTTADGGSILMLEGDELVHRAATGFMSGHTGERLGLMDTFSGSVYRSNQSAICNDTSTLPNPLASQRGIASLIAVPLRHHGGAVGLLTVLSRTPNAFDDDDLSTLELLAVVLSAAISHAFEFEALTRFHTMFVGASVGIVRFDASGRAVEANPALATMLGYSAAELATIPFTQYTHPDDFGANLTLFTETMEGKRDTFQLEKRYRRKDPSHPTRSIQRCRRSS